MMCMRDILRAHLEAISADRAHALATLAMEAEEEIASIKEQCRAFVTDDAWVAEQTAIAAAIARTMQERRQRHTDIVARWEEWSATGLRTRLEALGTD